MLNVKSQALVHERWDQDVGEEEGAHVGAGSRSQQPPLGKRQGEGGGGPHRRPGRRTPVPVQPGGDVEGDDRRPSAVDRVDQFGYQPLWATPEPVSDQGVDDRVRAPDLDRRSLTGGQRDAEPLGDCQLLSRGSCISASGWPRTMTTAAPQMERRRPAAIPPPPLPPAPATTTTRRPGRRPRGAGRGSAQPAPVRRFPSSGPARCRALRP